MCHGLLVVIEVSGGDRSLSISHSLSGSRRAWLTVSRQGLNRSTARLLVPGVQEVPLQPAQAAATEREQAHSQPPLWALNCLSPSLDWHLLEFPQQFFPLENTRTHTQKICWDLLVTNRDVPLFCEKLAADSISYPEAHTVDFRARGSEFRPG